MNTNDNKVLENEHERRLKRNQYRHNIVMIVMYLNLSNLIRIQLKRN